MSGFNPDDIRSGDQVTLSVNGGLPSIWTVAQRHGPKLTIEDGHGDVKNITLGGRRSALRILGHQPQLS